jgi:hypothetical protein
MTSKDALDEANRAAPGERARRYESRCERRGGCRQEPFEHDPGRWTWCPDCMTVFDDYGKPVNPLSAFPPLP